MSDLLRKAVLSDIPRIGEIWQASFGDEKRYIDFFTSKRFNDIVALVMEKDGRIVSQLFLMPCRIKSLSGYYLYAAATDNAYRGQGAMASLLRFSEELAKSENKDFIFLVPGTESLYRYYERFGYKEAFYKNITSMSDFSITDVNGTFSSDTEDAVSFLKNADDTVIWNDLSLLYGTEEFASFRGKVLTSENAVIMLDGETATVICRTEELMHTVSALYNATKRDDFTIVTNASFGQRAVGGMILTLTKDAETTDFDDVFVLFAKE